MTHIFTGDNSYEIKKRYIALVDNFIKQHGNLALEKFDGDEVSVQKVVDAVNNLPLLASKKMVVINDLQNKEVLEIVAELDVSDSCELVITASKIDKRDGYYKKLSKLPGFVSLSTSSEKSLPSWVINETKMRGGTIDQYNARYLVDMIGFDQMLLSSEINKLITYSSDITKETIDLLCQPTPQTTIFQLLDAAFTGNLQEALKLYNEQRVQKVEPIAIMGMIAWQLHTLTIIKLAGKRTPSEIAKDAQIKPYVVQKSMKIAKRIRFQHLKHLVSEATRLEIDLKSKNIDPDEALMYYITLVASQSS